MILDKLLNPQRTLVVVQEVELYIKKLNWKEFSDFQKFAGEMVDDESATIALCEHIIENYVTDAKGQPAIAKENIKDLPVEFCVDLVEVFIQKMNRNATEEDVKKK